MDQIENFKKIRSDGVIATKETQGQTDKNGTWTPNNPIVSVTSISWEYNGNPVVLHTHRDRITGEIVPGGQFVAVIESDSDPNSNSNLSVINADGSLKLNIPNSQFIKISLSQGQFGWFEPSRIKKENCFGVIFHDRAKNGTYQLDIDALSGKVLNVQETR